MLGKVKSDAATAAKGETMPRVTLGLRARDLWRKVDYYSLLAQLSLIFGLSLVIAAGPELQSFISAALSSNQASLYDSLRDGQISHFYQYDDWIFASLWPPLLMMATVIVAISCRTSDPRSIFLRACLSAFLTLTVGDLLGAFFLSGNAMAGAIENAASNLVGAPVLAAILLLFCIASETASRGQPRHYGKALALLIPAAIGFCINSGFFVFAKTIYAVGPSKIDIVVSAPIKGYYGVSTGQEAKSPKQESDPFGFFITPSKSQRKFSWTGMSRGFEFDWRKSGIGPYTVTISLFQGCMSPESLHNLRGDFQTIKRTNASNLHINLSDGLSHLAILSSGHIKAASDDVNQFYMTKDKDQNFDLTLFIDPEIEIEDSNWDDDIEFFFFAFLENNKSPQHREITIHSDSFRSTYDFSPPASISPSSMVRCRGIDIDPSGAKREKKIDELAISGLVRVSPPQTNNVFSRSPDIGTFKGLSGWLEAKKIAPSELSSFINAGPLDALLFDSKTDALFIDGEKYLSRPSDRLQVTNGKLQGAVTEDNRLRFTGESDEIFINNTRASKTRWEKIDLGWKIFLIGPLATFFYYLYKGISARLRSNAKFENIGSIWRI